MVLTVVPVDSLGDGEAAETHAGFGSVGIDRQLLVVLAHGERSLTIAVQPIGFGVVVAGTPA